MTARQSNTRLRRLVLLAVPMLAVAGMILAPAQAYASTTVHATIRVTGTYDGGGGTFIAGSELGNGGQSEGQKPVFELAAGATIRNLTIGSPAADGIHCLGSCTIRNVKWTDVGEDAATFLGSSPSNQYLVDGGSATSASDKVFQHNGAGTLTIQNFAVSNFGKLYRSCGNCGSQYKRSVAIKNVTATAPGKVLAGINTNYGDKATFSNVTIKNDPSKKIGICWRYTGNNTGAEPVKTGSGADGTYCKYSTSDIHYS